MPRRNRGRRRIGSEGGFRLFALEYELHDRWQRHLQSVRDRARHVQENNQ